MKKVMMAIVVALSMSLGVMAQEEQQDSREGRGNMNQTEMVQRRTDGIVKRYGLNEEQAKQLLELNKKYAGKMGPRMGMQGRPRRMDGDSVGQRRPRMERPAMRPDSTQRMRPQMRGGNPEEMRKTMEAYNAELQKIMTEEQFKAYQEDMKNRQPRGGRGPRQR